jgi:hypothetical protein
MQEIPEAVVTSQALLGWSTTVRSYDRAEECIFASMTYELDKFKLVRICETVK